MSAAELIAVRLEGQGAQGLHFDEAAGPVLGGRRRVQPIQERDRPIGKALGEKQAGQHQMAGFPGVVGIVVRVEAAAAGPVGGSGEIALGQLQPSSLRRNGVEQAGGARGVVLGFAHRVEGSHAVTARLADPRQRRQADGQRQGVNELPAQADAVGGIVEGGVEIVALVGHLCEGNQRGASGR